MPMPLLMLMLPPSLALEEGDGATALALLVRG